VNVAKADCKTCVEEVLQDQEQKSAKLFVLVEHEQGVEAVVEVEKK
jgi:hypothetical protein